MKGRLSHHENEKKHTEEETKERMEEETQERELSMDELEGVSGGWICKRRQRKKDLINPTTDTEP